VPAPSSGVIKELKVENGATVTSGQVLAILEAGEVAAAAPASKTEAPAAAETKAAAASGGKLAPAAKRMVEEHKLDASQIAGSGRDGRVSKGDVIQHLSGASKQQAAPAPAAKPAPAVKLPAPVGSRNEQRVPMTRLRARIAERLIQAQSTAAMLTTFKASIEALRKFPAVNASIDGNDIVYHEFYDVGVAVSTDRGLMVPVIRNAEALSFADLEISVGEYAKKARDGSISLEELTGGTFTITNGGVFGSLMSTPILNPPQVAILGMHKIQERPMVVDGEIKIRPMMYLALTYDHRIVDGRESVQFLVAIKEALEDPARLLLQL
jgi:2-oxoglutarate dehydrogenase E2 component (dihydrolipoamide succinyltransferase)